MAQLYVLFEHASGFTIFRTSEFEEIAIFLPQVRQSITDISKFRSIVSLVAFQPFKTQKEALSNMKSISAGELSTDLQLFLENNIPRTKKSKQAIVLGVQEPGLASEISDKLNINCNTSGVVKEIIRGLRFHFNKLVKGFKDAESAGKAQLALAHNFSRGKVNFDSTRQDCMIIQSHSLVDELEKDINTLTRRIREWYSLHFPELHALVGGDVELYVKCVQTIGDRKNLPDDIEKNLNTLIGDSSKVEAVLQAAHSSMGMEIATVDLENMNMFCDRVLSLIKKRQNSLDYLKAKMNVTAPSVSTLVGELVGSRLISRAGGLANLAKLPASTVQILGADKKLFRVVKGKEKADTCGLISKSAFMGRAGKSKKGHLARILANKCSLAARVDCFSKNPKLAYGSQLIQDVQRIVKLHKLFRNDLEKDIKKPSEQSTTDIKEKVRGRKSRRKTEKNPANWKNSSTLNKSTLLATEQSPVAKSVLNSTGSPVKRKGKKSIPKGLSKSEVNGESHENVSETMGALNLSKKRISQAVVLSNAVDSDVEMCDLQEKVFETKTPLKRSKRLSMRKSIRN